MTVVDVLGRVAELAEGLGGSVDAGIGATIDPNRKSRFKVLIWRPEGEATRGEAGMNERMLRWLCIVAAALDFCSPAQAIVRTDQVIVNGTLQTDNAKVANTDWTGVGLIPFGPGTGVLLDATHVLTAAHVFYGQDGTGGPLDPTLTATFQLIDPITGQLVTLNSKPFGQGGLSVAPGFLDANGVGQGHRIVGKDLAVLTLATAADVTKFMPYPINTGQIPDERTPMPQGKFVLVGFSKATGDGVNFIAGGPFTPNVKRLAFNNVDQFGDGVTTWTAVGDRTKNGKIDPPPPANTLVFDFDQPGQGNSSGLTNAINANMSGAVGNMEGSVIGGDSGGPLFQMGQDGKWYIVGITSSGSDTMGRFGSIAYATRVRSYADFINAALAVPEPSTILLVATALGGLGVCAWRRTRFRRSSAP